MSADKTGKTLTRLLLFFLFFNSHKIKSQSFEYFQLIDSVKVNSVEVYLKEKVNDTISMELNCIAYYSAKNILDSIICKNLNNRIISRFKKTLTLNSVTERTIYYNESDNSEIYRTEEFIKGRYSYLEYSNNINNNGYKLTTILDDNCIAVQNLKHVNGVLVRKEIIANIYDTNRNFDNYCQFFLQNAFMQIFRPIYLNNNLSLATLNSSNISDYEEVKSDTFYIYLNGDTIVKTSACFTNNCHSVEKIFANDTSYIYEKSDTFTNYFGKHKSVSKISNYNNLSIEESHTIFEGVNIDDYNRYNKSVTNLHEVYQFWRDENMDKTTETYSILKKIYTSDKYGNWIEGLFEGADNKKWEIKRIIRYN